MKPKEEMRIDMRYGWLVFLLVTPFHSSFAEDCQGLVNVAFTVGQLKEEGLSAEEMRTEVLSSNELSAEVKVIFMQHIEMSFSQEHLEKSAKEYASYVDTLCQTPSDDQWLEDLDRELEELNQEKSSPLVKRGWYIFYVGKNHMEFLHPETFRTFGNSVTYSHMTYEYAGEYKGERLDVKYEVDCSKFISREVSNTSISNWSTGNFIKELGSKEGWKSPKPRSVLERRSEIACDFYEMGEKNLLIELEDMHEQNYQRANDLGIELF